jgi:hypothetical protein
MSKEAATTEELAGLHKQVAESLVADITLPPVEGEAVELKIAKLRMRHDARAQAITFLKNNNITAAQGNKDLDALAQALTEQRNRRSGGALSDTALDEAADIYGARLQ